MLIHDDSLAAAPARFGHYTRKVNGQEKEGRSEHKAPETRGVQTMLWAIRGTDRTTDKDITLVVDAVSRAEAECMAIRRNFPVVIIEPASDEDIVEAKQRKLLYVATKGTRMPYTAFGKPVGKLKLAF